MPPRIEDRGFQRHKYASFHRDSRPAVACFGRHGQARLRPRHGVQRDGGIPSAAPAQHRFGGGASGGQATSANDPARSLILIPAYRKPSTIMRFVRSTSPAEYRTVLRSGETVKPQ